MANKVETVPGSVRALKYEQITDLSTAKSLNPPDDAAFAFIQADTQAVRWRADGADPTSSVGMPLPKDTLFQCTCNLTEIKFIEQTSGATLNVHYFGI
ncbi:MAG: hypothetical protein JSR91_00160 [Proteobacteria bacterium]|nr:hypothetical protein [Pseudomonadota bacterium]